MKHTRQHALFLITFTVLLTLLRFVLAADAQFVVRTIYFQPQGTPDRTTDIRKMMADTHDFIGREMQRNGFGFKTFRIEKDTNDEIVVHTVKGQHPTATYNADTTYNAISPELPNRFKVKNNIHIIFVGGMQRINHLGISALGVGISSFGNQIGGYAVIPANHLIFQVVVHEVAHTFGLQHNLDPFTDFVMGLDAGFAGFAEYEARWLDKNHYFNDDHPNINAVPKVVRTHPIRVIDIQEHIIEIKVDLQGINGIHQAEIARYEDGGILDTHFLHANRIDTAVFQFNVQLLRGATQAAVRVLDTHGNFWIQEINLDIPPAAFFEPEPTIPLKPEPLKPTKPEPIKPEPVKPEPIKPEPDNEKAETTEPDKGRNHNVKARRKFILLWAKLKL